jgi:hypothetical protein
MILFGTARKTPATEERAFCSLSSWPALVSPFVPHGATGTDRQNVTGQDRGTIELPDHDYQTPPKLYQYF